MENCSMMDLVCPLHSFKVVHIVMWLACWEQCLPSASTATTSAFYTKSRV